jgi:hypothetical protein
MICFFSFLFFFPNLFLLYLIPQHHHHSNTTITTHSTRTHIRHQETLTSKIKTTRERD